MQQTIVLQPPLYFSPDNDHIWNTSFHPSQPIIAASSINGSIQILKYSSDDVERLLKISTVHKGSVRWVTFNKEGTLLASCSEDKRLGFLNAEGEIAHVIKKAHSNPINRCEFVDQHIFMSGDDDGEVKLWDLRTTEAVFEAKEQADTISGLRFDQTYTNIISSSLDGTIAIYDVKKGSTSQQKLYAISQPFDEELNGLELMRDGKYIICPSSESSVVIFKRDNIETYCDRIQGIPGSVDCLLKLNDNTFLTGSEDGFVRGLSFKPNKIVQTIGQHEEDENFPIESLSLSHCGNIVASTSHDNSIKFYDVSEFVKKRFNESSQVKEEDEQSQKMDIDSMEQQKVKIEGNESDYEDQDSDMDDDSEDDDSEDSDEMEEEKKKKKKGPKKVNIKAREKEIKRDKQKSFFKGL